MRSMPLFAAGGTWPQPAATVARRTQKRGRSSVWISVRIAMSSLARPLRYRGRSRANHTPAAASAPEPRLDAGMAQDLRIDDKFRLAAAQRSNDAGEAGRRHVVKAFVG